MRSTPFVSNEHAGVPLLLRLLRRDSRAATASFAQSPGVEPSTRTGSCISLGEWCVPWYTGHERYVKGMISPARRIYSTNVVEDGPVATTIGCSFSGLRTHFLLRCS